MLSIHADRTGYASFGFSSIECYDPAALGEHMTRGIWCAPIFAGGRRGEIYFLAAEWCALDVDEGATKQEVLDVFRGHELVLGPTKSDGIPKTTKSGLVKPACDRFRICLRFAQPIYSFDVFKYNMKLLSQKIGGDLSAIDAARVWQPCKSIEVVERGAGVDVVTEIPVEESQAFQDAKIEEYIANLKKGRVLPKRVKNFMDGKISLGERNVELYFAACVLMQVKGWKVNDVRKMAHSMPVLKDMDNIETTIRSAARRVGAAYF